MMRRLLIAGGVGVGLAGLALLGGWLWLLWYGHASQDPTFFEDEIAAFWKEIEAAEADWQLITYPGAVHAFTQEMAGNDPSRGAAYNAVADRRSWADMKSFFDEILAK